MEDDSRTVEVWNVEITGDASALRRELQSAASFGRQFTTAMVNSFQDIVTKSRSVGDALRSLALRLSDLVLKAAFRPLEQGFSNVFSTLLSGGGLGFAKNGVLNSETPIPFANGGVISSPIAFPLGDEKTGIAGERGAEAIMPLARGPDGSLGVKAQGGRAVTVNFNVVAQDAQSFVKSESQISAMLARAVSFGNRNL